MYFLFLSQVVDPNGTAWSFSCQASEPFDSTGFATAFYNDPNQDCISNEFLIIFNYNDGHTEPWTPLNQYEHDPTNGGYYDFNSNFWSCCEDVSGGGNNSGGEDSEGCPCDWTVDGGSGFLIIECPPATDDCN